MLAGQPACVKGEVLLNVLLGQDRGTRRHIAHQGHLVPPGPGGVVDGNGPGLALGLGDEPRFPQALHMEVDGGGGFQVYRRGNLPHRGGIAVLLGKGEDVVIDLLLFWGQFDHSASSFQE